MTTSEPALVHPWFGPLYPHGEHELLGSIDVDAQIRAPRNNGDHDLEVVLVTHGLPASPAPTDHLEQSVARIKSSLAALSDFKVHVLEHAPQEWVAYYSAQPGPTLFERLFLDGIEVEQDLGLRLVFDFGDLDQIVVTIDAEGHPGEVFLRP